MTLKKFSLGVNAFFLCLLVASCTGAGLKVKVYWLDSENAQLVRCASEINGKCAEFERLPISKATDHYCMPHDDFNELLDAYLSCKEGHK